MVRVIMGHKGSGKTKQMIELVNAAVDSAPGVVVLIEKGRKLTYDIHHGVRLVNASDYGVAGNDMLRGLIAGLHAGNYDISHVFIDSLYKITGVDDSAQTEALCAWLDSFGQTNGIDFVVTISADHERAPEGLRRYF